MQNPTDQAEATVPEETVSNDSPNWNRTVAVRRKAAKRTNPFELTAEELHLMSPSPQEAEDIPARKKPRLEEPFPTATDEAATKTAYDVAVGLPSAAADNDTVNADPMTHTQPNAGATRATGHWTSEEDATLTRAVANTPMKKWGKEYKPDWNAFTALVPGRTQLQCYDRWRAALDPNIVRVTGRKGRWTADEDTKLKDAVQLHGGKKWVAIAALVPGRKQKQCLNRWKNVLDPSTALDAGHTGKWAEDEDKKLKDAVQLHGGKDWAAIAALVPDRTRPQCVNRWHNALNPSIAVDAGRTGTWAEDEVTKLKDAVQTHGDKNWGAIAALVLGRTKSQCCKKWRHMESNRSTVREKVADTLKKVPAALGQHPHSS
jgi:hypothetical protein